jgi:hypothetical protein
MYHPVFQVLLALSCLYAVLSQTCYWPDGSEAFSYKPCLNGKGPCCYHTDVGHHDLCYENGFCYSYTSVIYTGVPARIRALIVAPGVLHNVPTVRLNDDEQSSLSPNDSTDTLCLP